MGLLSAAMMACSLTATARADLLVLNSGGSASHVIRFNAEGMRVNTFGHQTEAYYTMKRTSDNTIYVSSNILGQHSLQVFNGAGQYLGAAAQNTLVGLRDGTRGPDGAIYAIGRDDVSEGSSDASSVLRIVGPTATRFIPNGSAGMTVPAAFVFGPDGNLYVNDTNIGIMRFSGSTGAPMGVFVPLGRGGLEDVAKMQFGPDGRLYVATNRANAVLRFDGSTGAFIDTFVASGSGSLVSPAGLAFGPDGHLYVTSGGTNQVLRFNGATGDSLGVAAASDSTPGDPRVRWRDIVFENGLRGADSIWFDDAVPAGAMAGTSHGGPWTWVSDNPAPHSGTQAHRAYTPGTASAGLQEHFFNFAREPMIVGQGDSLIAYVFLDGDSYGNREIMISWCDDSWEHRAYWGADLIQYGSNGTNSRRYMGPLPDSYGWQRLEVPARLLGLEGRSVQGMSFSVMNNWVTFDRVGKTTFTPVASSDLTPPTVALTAPADGATVSGEVTLSAVANDNVSVARVQFFLNGVELQAADTTAPFAITWNSTSAVNGSHVLSAVATDPAGNASSPSTRMVVVNNTDAPPPPPPPPPASDRIWFDDDVPPGASIGATGGDSWTWVTSSPAPASGARAHQSNLAPGLHEHFFDWAYGGAFSIGSSDTLTAWVYLDPSNPPQQIMLSWRADSWEHRAYWGANRILYGTDGTNSRRRMGDLPPAGVWTKLTIPASAVGLENTSVMGMSFSAFDGRVTWDATGVSGGGDANPGSGGGDATDPTVVITAPGDNATVSGNAVTLAASASDNVGVASVLFRVNDTNLGSADTTAPFGIFWDSTTVADGSHAITAIATDAAGNSTTSAPVIVSVNNGSSGSSGGAVIWMDSAIPSGAWTGAAGGDAWTWITSNPAPFAGTRVHQSSNAAGLHEHYFTGASPGLQVFAGDTLFVYVYLDPENPPSGVMLSWFDGTWEHRAYWGENRFPYGTDGTASRRSMGPLPATGQWVQLQIPAAQVGLESRTITGMSFSLFNGRATWDIAGRVGQ